MIARFAQRPMWVALVAGALAALGQAPVSQPWITVIALGVGLLLFQQTTSWRNAARLGWTFGLGYFALSLHWIVEPFLVDIARHGWMAPFALFGLAAGLALFWGGAFGIAKACEPKGAVSALAWATFLTLAELARSYLLTGFPWALIGHVWIGWPPMQWAAVVGPIGLTFITLLIVAFFVVFRSKPAQILGLAAFVAAFAMTYVFVDRQQPNESANRPFIRLIQPNAAQHLKWHPDHVLGFFDRQLDFTRQPSERPLDLIIWPETSVPWLLDNAEGPLDSISVAAGETPVVLGMQRREGRAVYNSLVALDTEGVVTNIYDKHHLVPFGEYVPAYGLLAALPFGAFVDEHGFGYTPGPGARVLDLGALGKVLPLICYEAVFPYDLNAASERSDWILQITNDAWFGNWVGPYQHLAQARLRAVEQGLPLVRVANTGVSALIDPFGNVLAELPLNEAGFLDVALPTARSATIYSRTGDWPATLLLFVIFLALVGRRSLFRH